MWFVVSWTLLMLLVAVASAPLAYRAGLADGRQAEQVERMERVLERRQERAPRHARGGPARQPAALFPERQAAARPGQPNRPGAVTAARMGPVYIPAPLRDTGELRLREAAWRDRYAAGCEADRREVAEAMSHA